MGGQWGIRYRFWQRTGTPYLGPWGDDADGEIRRGP